MNNKYDKTNIFSKILRSEISCQKVLENDYALAFLDINPQAPIHILIIPKNEYIDFHDFTENGSSQEVTYFWKLVCDVINSKNIFLLVDQKDSAGTEVNFFGKKVKTQTGFLKIARKYQLKLIPMKNIRLPDNKLQITFEQPLLHNKDEVSDENKMLEINSIIEKWIRDNPDNWFWQHKRFN